MLAWAAIVRIDLHTILLLLCGVCIHILQKLFRFAAWMEHKVDAHYYRCNNYVARRKTIQC